jgi:hypothetical protein
MRDNYRSKELHWRGNDLHLVGSPRVLASIVPDSQYPNMWRVRHGGRLSDMLNRTRARDVARAAALAVLNSHGTPLEAAQESFSGEQGSTLLDSRARARPCAARGCGGSRVYGWQPWPRHHHCLGARRGGQGAAGRDETATAEGFGMMMGSSTITASTISESLDLINAMLNAQTAKQVLTELGQKVDDLNKKRDEIAALRKQAETDRAAADARIAEAETRVGAIQAREQAVTAREQKFETMRSEVRRKIAAVEA